MPQLKLTEPTRPNPNQLSDDEHEQLHTNPPDIPYGDLERLIRDWIMNYEGYNKLFLPILVSNGVDADELKRYEDPEVEDIALIESSTKAGQELMERMDAIKTLYNASLDRAYLIVLIKLYQMTVDWSPRQNYPTRKEG